MTDPTGPVPTGDSATRLSVVVGQLNRRLRTAPGGLSHAVLSALATIQGRGPLRLAELAAAEVVSAPSITRVVAALEERGLVTRTPDPADGRAALLAITAEGAARLAAAREERASVLRELMAGLPEADRRSLEAALPALEALLSFDASHPSGAHPSH